VIDEGEQLRQREVLAKILEQNEQILEQQARLIQQEVDRAQAQPGPPIEDVTPPTAVPLSLHACPFCGGRSLIVVLLPELGAAWLRCERCKAAGPRASSPDTAVDAWDTRIRGLRK